MAKVSKEAWLKNREKVEELIREAGAIDIGDIDSVGKLVEKIDKLPRYAFVDFNEITGDFGNTLSNYYNSVQHFQNKHYEFLAKMEQRDNWIQQLKTWKQQ